MKKFYIFQYKNTKCSVSLKYFFLLVIILSQGVANAADLAQIIKEKRVTINAVNQKLDKILSDINVQSKVEYGYQSNDDIDKNQLFSLSVKNATVEEALTQLFKGSKYSFRVVDDKLVIYKIKEAKPQPVTGKKVTVTGKVIDQTTNDPIAGATVIVVETGAGAITDESGKFMLIVNDGYNYEISYVGMKPHKAKVAQTNGTITIPLQRDAMQVDDVVVTGYQTLSRRESASAVTVIKQDEIHVQGAPSLAQMLQGKIAGMSVMNTSGEPSATPKIRIRGNSTLNGNQAPVWVVDGIILEQPVPFNASDINSDDAAYLIGNAIAGVNPQDIETITVLKDASATAIYGVKAANGVIVLTTKKGAVGRAVVRYSGDVSINPRPGYNNLDRMNSAQRVQLSSDIVDAGIKYPRIPSGDSYEGALEELYRKKITQDQFSQKVSMLQRRNTDWFKELFRTSVSHTHNLNVSGGTNDVKYYFSTSYNNNMGGAIKSSSERLTTMGKVDVKLNKFIDFTTKIEYNTTENDGYSGVNPFSYAYQRSRTLPLYNEDGSLAYYNQTDRYSYNVLNELNTTGNSSKIDNFNGLLNLNVNLVKGLRYSGTFSYGTSNTSQRAWATERSNAVARMRGYDYNKYTDTSDEYKRSVIPYGGKLSNSKNRSRNYTIRNTLSYAATFNEKHDLNIMAGAEARSTLYEGVSVMGYGWSPDFGEVFNPVHTDNFVNDVLKTGMLRPTNTNNITQVGSFFASGTYTYGGKYILNANIRSDGANKFGSNPDYRWLPTWSVAGKWIITGEQFMKEQKVFDLLAIRGSYGIQGNIQEDATPDLIIRGGDRDDITGQPTHKIVRLPNPDLRWEKTNSWNAGIDFTILDSRISGSFDVYKKYTTDLIMNKMVSTSNGRSVIFINGGEMNNFGVEGNVNFELIRSKNFDWRFGLNLGHNSNEVIIANGDVYNNIEQIDMLLRGDLAVEGAPAGSMYSYVYSGLSGTNGYPLFRAKDGRLVHQGEPQLLELTNSGSIFPKLSGGFDTQFTFKKRLILSLGFAYNIGGVKRLPTVYEDKTKVFDPLSNVSTKLINRWRNPGDEKYTDIPALLDDRITDNFIRNGLVAARPGVTGKLFTELYDKSDSRTASSDYLRLKMIAVTYSLPESILKKIKLSNMTVRFQANNVHVWASKKWEGLDPETPDTNIPVLPSYSLGVNISF